MFQLNGPSLFDKYHQTVHYFYTNDCNVTAVMNPSCSSINALLQLDCVFESDAYHNLHPFLSLKPLMNFCSVNALSYIYSYQLYSSFTNFFRIIVCKILTLIRWCHISMHSYNVYYHMNNCRILALMVHALFVLPIIALIFESSPSLFQTVWVRGRRSAYAGQ